jgi:hypothetical protein
LELKEYGKIEELVALPPPEHTATGMPLLDQAFADLALGRVRMGQAAETGASGRVGGLTLLDEARTYLTRALKAMDEAKTEHHRPRVLLTRAALFRSRNEWELAAGDLQLARVIAERGNMKIHLADSMIQLAHLHLARGDRHGAAEMISHVRHRVREMEYHRRAPEVEELVRILAVVS